MTSWISGPILFFFSLSFSPSSLFSFLSTQNALYILIPAFLVFFLLYSISLLINRTEPNYSTHPNHTTKCLSFPNSPTLYDTPRILSMGTRSKRYKESSMKNG
jgi:hypothetical protein